MPTHSNWLYMTALIMPYDSIWHKGTIPVFMGLLVWHRFCRLKHCVYLILCSCNFLISLWGLKNLEKKIIWWFDSTWKLLDEKNDFSLKINGWPIEKMMIRCKSGRFPNKDRLKSICIMKGCMVLVTNIQSPSKVNSHRCVHNPLSDYTTGLITKMEKF